MIYDVIRSNPVLIIPTKELAEVRPRLQESFGCLWIRISILPFTRDQAIRIKIDTDSQQIDSDPSSETFQSEPVSCKRQIRLTFVFCAHTSFLYKEHSSGPSSLSSLF